MILHTTNCVNCGIKLEISSILINECGHNFICEICANNTREVCETCGKLECNGKCCKCKFCVKNENTIK